MSSFNAAAVSLASPRREDDFTGDDEALARQTLARPGRHLPLARQRLANGHWSGLAEMAQGKAIWGEGGRGTGQS